MTGRERLSAVLCKRPTDRLPWTTLVDNNTLSGLPEHLQGNHGIDFYRYLGCDILMLNGWNTPCRFCSPQMHWGDEVRVTEQQEGQQRITRWETPRGVLTAVYEKNHPVKYPVDSIESVRIFQTMWEGASYSGPDDSETLARIDALIGNDGVVTRFWGPSAIPRLLEMEMGTENFYYLLNDHPDAVEALIRTIHDKQRQAFRILAEGPWDSVTLVENTSTFYISPEIYEKFNMPHQREFVETVRNNGKTAILHMCGHVRNLLDLIKETGCDGIHVLTPPPTGDCPWEEALDVLGDDLIIFGCLDPSVFVMGNIEDVSRTLDSLITPRLKEGNFVLSPAADGICVSLERFDAVKEWMEENA